VNASDSNSLDEKKPEPGSSYSVVGCGGAVLGVLVLLLFVAYVLDAFQRPSLAIFGAAESWAYFIGNLVVACYCFPAFKATKERAFLYLAFAALGFTYGALFTLLFGPRLPSSSSREQLIFYYGMRHFVETAGLVLYVWGVVLLARRAQGKRSERV
jgi:hypothetical protein